MTPEDRAEFIEELTAAIHTRTSDVSLTDQEKQWVRNAIKMQEQTYKLRVGGASAWETVTSV